MQRGNNRLPCFLDDTDRACYRQLLREGLLATGCRLHAYMLMDRSLVELRQPVWPARRCPAHPRPSTGKTKSITETG